MCTNWLVFRVVAVVLQKRIVVLDAGSLEYRFIVKSKAGREVALLPRILACVCVVCVCVCVKH